MKKNSPRKTTLFLLTLAICAFLLGTANLSAAEEPAFHMVTGQVTGLQGTVITLDGKGLYYPISEIYLPSWVKEGESASLLYVSKGYIKYYYEIVQPGQKFTILDDRSTGEKATR
ncbi:MAG: hypothetical protein DRN37_05170 [Thermoplasmata archaeon]|nr:MAG: hypothetical protein DRN37_05170 [Thermoplasmata archaeon]